MGKQPLKEQRAKKIAESINKFRLVNGSTPIGNNASLLKQLNIFKCMYVTKVASILKNENVIVAKGEQSENCLYFSDPDKPVHWSIFLKVGDKPVIQNIEKFRKKETPHKIAYTLNDMKRNIGYLEQNLLLCVREISENEIINLMSRCSEAQDRSLLYNLYRLHNTVWYSIENELSTCKSITDDLECK